MFFELYPIRKSDKFSYAISKHPDNSYEREFGSGRVVVGRWKLPGHAYEGFVKNSFSNYIDKMRKNNMSSYLAEEIYCVCPSNLRGFRKVFTTAMRSNNPDDMVSDWEMIIGPYTITHEYLEKIMDEADLNCQCDKTLGECFVAKIWTRNPIPLSEFLQKVYVLSFMTTVHIHQTIGTKLNQTKIIAEMSKEWMEDITDETAIKLARKISYHRDDIEKITKRVIPEWQESAHQRRHDLIANICNNLFINNLLELGSGTGQLLRTLYKSTPISQMVGLEKDSDRVSRSFKPYKRVKIFNTDITFPYLDEKYLQPDMLIMTEVIEHMEKQKRDEVLFLIKNYYKPDYFIITAPNIDFNKTIGLDGFRRNDHKIEYKYHEFVQQVCEPLSEKYKLKLLTLNSEFEPDSPNQVSFVLMGKRHEGI